MGLLRADDGYSSTSNTTPAASAKSPAYLGVSKRHLRRVFREAVGVSPKAFAKLTRFHRALRAAREDIQIGARDRPEFGQATHWLSAARATT